MNQGLRSERVERESVVHDLESTARLPVLDIASYEAELAAMREAEALEALQSLEPPEASADGADGTTSIPVLHQPHATAPLLVEPPPLPEPSPAPQAAEAPAQADPRAQALEVDLEAILAARTQPLQERVDALNAQLARFAEAMSQVDTARRDSEAREAQAIAQLQEMRASRDAAEARIAEVQAQMRLEHERALAEGAMLGNLSREAERAAQLRNAQLLEQLETLRENARDAEGRRGLWEGLLLEAESSRDAQIARLNADMLELGSVRAESERLARLIEQQTQRAARAEARAAQAQAQAAAAEQRATQAEARAATGEASALEAHSRATGADAQRDKAEQRAAAAEERASAAESRAAAAESRAAAAEASAQEQAARADGLQAELLLGASEREALRGELQVLQAELQALRSARSDALAAAASAVAAPAATAIASLESPSIGAEGPETFRVLQEQMRQTGERIGELETDLRAAEDQINRLEGELRVKSERLAELARGPWPQSGGTAPATGGAGMARRRSDDAGHQATSTAGSAPLTAEGTTRYLVLMDGDTEIVHVLGRRTTVGRGLDNDIRIDTRYVSRNHGVVLAGPTQTIVEDLRSTNGIMVNGRRVTRAALRDGDIVHFGKSQFRFVQRTRERAI